MKARELLKILRDLGCTQRQGKGSHVRVTCGTCNSTIAVHAGEDIPRGTLKGIERDLEPCLGKDWLSKRR